MEPAFFYDLDLHVFYYLAVGGEPFDLAGEAVEVLDGGDGGPDFQALLALRPLYGVADDHEGVVGGGSYHVGLDLEPRLIGGKEFPSLSAGLDLTQ